MIAGCFEILTVGLPFCAFKIIAGTGLNQQWLTGWGCIDLMINTANLVSFLIRKKGIFASCLLALLIQVIKKSENVNEPRWRDFGNAIDVLLSFGLVAFMLAGGFLSALKPGVLWIWNAAVILNVLGAGSSRLTASIRSLKNMEKP